MADLFLVELDKWIKKNNFNYFEYIFKSLVDVDSTEYIYEMFENNVNYTSDFLRYIRLRNYKKDNSIIEYIREAVSIWGSYFNNLAIINPHIKHLTDTLIFFGLEIKDTSYKYFDDIRKNLDAMEMKMKRAEAGRKIFKAVKGALNDEVYLTELRMRIDLRKYTDLCKEKESLVDDVMRIIKSK